MLSGFKQFVLRGNVVDLAVGVVIGAAFGEVVSAFTKDLLTPMIAAFVGKPDFSSLAFHVNGTTFPVGDFLNTAVAFVLVAALIYFCVVTPVNHLVAKMKSTPVPADPTSKKCGECFNVIPVQATRCGFCAQPVMARAA
jgi:large conductance mechanosensitive channel